MRVEGRNSSAESSGLLILWADRLSADYIPLILDAAHPEKFSARQSGVILSGSLLNVIVIEQAAKTRITFHVLGEGRLRWVFEIEGNPGPGAI